MERGGCVYIMTNKYRTALYIGVTSDLPGRIWEHKNNHYPASFTTRYKLYYCVYYESFFSIQEAILREKELKGWLRKKKDMLITSGNPNWLDLWDEIKEW